MAFKKESIEIIDLLGTIKAGLDSCPNKLLLHIKESTTVVLMIEGPLMRGSWRFSQNKSGLEFDCLSKENPEQKAYDISEVYFRYQFPQEETGNTKPSSTREVYHFFQLTREGLALSNGLDTCSFLGDEVKPKILDSSTQSNGPQYHLDRGETYPPSRIAPSVLVEKILGSIRLFLEQMVPMVFKDPQEQDEGLEMKQHLPYRGAPALQERPYRHCNPGFINLRGFMEDMPTMEPLEEEWPSMPEIPMTSPLRLFEKPPLTWNARPPGPGFYRSRSAVGNLYTRKLPEADKKHPNLDKQKLVFKEGSYKIFSILKLLHTDINANFSVRFKEKGFLVDYDKDHNPTDLEIQSDPHRTITTWYLRKRFPLTMEYVPSQDCVNITLFHEWESTMAVPQTPQYEGIANLKHGPDMLFSDLYQLRATPQGTIMRGPVDETTKYQEEGLKHCGFRRHIYVYNNCMLKSKAYDEEVLFQPAALSQDAQWPDMNIRKNFALSVEEILETVLYYCQKAEYLVAEEKVHPSNRPKSTTPNPTLNTDFFKTPRQLFADMEPSINQLYTRHLEAKTKYSRSLKWKDYDDEGHLRRCADIDRIYARAQNILSQPNFGTEGSFARLKKELSLLEAIIADCVFKMNRLDEANIRVNAQMEHDKAMAQLFSENQGFRA